MVSDTVILAKPDFLFCVFSPRPSYQSLDLAVLFWRRSGLYRKLEEVPMGLDGDETSDWVIRSRVFSFWLLSLLSIHIYNLYMYLYIHDLGRRFFLFFKRKTLKLERLHGL